MKILLTGATGYIGRRLLPALLNDGHQVVCCVRDKNRFKTNPSKFVEVIEVDFLRPKKSAVIPEDIDVAYYLIHSMSASSGEFDSLEYQCAINFKAAVSNTQLRQVIYLSGIVNSDELSGHLRSRKRVEDALVSEQYALSTLRAGIILGSGSASFEIIRDLVEKLPVMIAPKWLNTRTQPIAIRNVIQYLKGIIFLESTYNRSLDIGGPDILTYKQMLSRFANLRGLKRYILTVPVMTPRLSSYWLYFVTSTSYRLAVNLVNSMKVEVVCRPNELGEELGIRPLRYEEAIKLAFDKISQEDVLPSWTDALSGQKLEGGLHHLMKVPTYGCLKDERSKPVTNEVSTLNKIWSIGGINGWYYGDWMWEVRGFLDKLVGGVGLQRGRRNQHSLSIGESLDFWRVIYASKEEKRLLLYAEMKLPGEAWLEWNIEDGRLTQTATFRPKGLWGRLYWYSLLPFHHFIFSGMIDKITE